MTGAGGTPLASHTNRHTLAAAAIAAAALASAAAGTARGVVAFGQLDNFQDGTTMGWREGSQFTPNPPTNVGTGGPAGAGDRYLRNASSGGFGAGSKQVMFNDTRWAGNFITARVTRLDAQMANFGATDLHMRVALRGGDEGAVDSFFASTDPVFLPANSGWRPVSFDLTSDALTKVGGPGNLFTVLSNVKEFRLLSADPEKGPTYSDADQIASTLGVDNIRALRLPGDANFDGGVDVADLGILATHFNSAGDWSEGDFTFDGQVNVSDLGVLATNFGQGAAEAPHMQSSSTTIANALAAYPQLAAAVPEPSSAAALLLAGAAFPLLRPRRRRSN